MNVIDHSTLNRLCDEVEQISAGAAVRRRAGATFAVRNILHVATIARKLIDSVSITALLRPCVDGEPRPVRAILFDKSPQANWSVTWHQDRTIAVRERLDVPGFGPWSVKAGVVHVQPPAAVLEDMVTLRLHLDDCDRNNGALKVVPGPHRRGILSDDEVAAAVEAGPIETCEIGAGGALLMRPLLLHASSASTQPRRRRVLHVEFAAQPLPSGLEWAKPW